jgi:hypothetical protein
MPFELNWTSAPKNMKLEVFQDPPDGYVEEKDFLFSSFRMARTSKFEYAYYCHWKDCKGWVLGIPNEYEENTMSPNHPLSGRQGTAYYCRRCGREIGFSGKVS